MSSTAMNVTTLTIHKDQIDYDKLKEFRLVKYRIPDSYWDDRSFNYGLVHNTYKDQLEHPYYFFTGGQAFSGLYVLYKQEEDVQTLTFDFLQDMPLEQQPVNFMDIPLHLLLKILAANYFIVRKETVSQNKFYLQAKGGKGKTITCLEIRINGAMENVDAQGKDLDVQQFKVTGHATRFRNKTPWKRREAQSAAKFKKVTKREGVYFVQLKPYEVEKFNGEKYYIYTESDKRAILHYHSEIQPETTRGYILHTFLKKFREYLQQYGITATQNVRNFKGYTFRLHSDTLPVQDLKTVYLFDNRLNTMTNPLEQYQTLLNTAYQKEFGITFECIQEADFVPSKPLLILQDCNQKDFERSEPLFGRDDPYQKIYNTYPQIPKQTINVNTNKPKQFTPETVEQYLQYPLFTLKNQNEDEFDFNNRLQVCLNELYLKDLILNGKDVRRLPCLDKPDMQISLFHTKTLLQEYTFIRRATQNGNNYTTLLYIENNQLRLIDLTKPKGKMLCEKLLKERYHVDWWDEVLEPCREKYRKKGTDEKNLRRFDFIIGPDQIIEIEDMNERVLYDYETLRERSSEVDTPYPLEQFKLSAYYDKIKPKKPSLSSVTLEQCQKYDVFLDSLADAGIYEISFNELTRGAYWQQILEIFDIHPDKKGKYRVTKLKKCYQQLGMFLSTKGKGIIDGYEGIWYDDENCFMVGSAGPFQMNQPRAHLIRKFDIYKGQNKFDIRLFLETMAVKFVRYNQFTVYPYFFHLIDLYVESKLFYE